MRTGLKRLLAASALGGGLLLLSATRAEAEPSVEVTDQTVTVEDPTPDQTIIETADEVTPAAPTAAEAAPGQNEAVVGEPASPGDPSANPQDVVSPSATVEPVPAGASTDDSSADTATPAATAEPDATVCGNAVGVVGEANAECTREPDGDALTVEPTTAEAEAGDDTPAPGTEAEATTPSSAAEPEVTVCGNGASVAGDAEGTCAPTGDAPAAGSPGSASATPGDATPASGTEAGTSVAPVRAAPEAGACGNGAGVAGDGSGSCAPASSSGTTSPAPTVVQATAGGDTAASGSTVALEAPPADTEPRAVACGNGAGALGSGAGRCSPALLPTTEEPVVVRAATLGEDASVESPTPATSPDVVVCANGAGVLGTGTGGCGPAPDRAGPDDDPTTVTPPFTGGIVTLGELTPVVSLRPNGTIAPLVAAGLLGLIEVAELAEAGGEAAADLARLAAGAAADGARALAATGFAVRAQATLALLLVALGLLLQAVRRRESEGVVTLVA